MKFEIKGLKTWNTHDGGGYQFNLYIDGKKALWVHNDGNGGCLDITPLDVKYPNQWSESKLYKMFRDYLKTLPKYEMFGELFDMDEEIFLEELLNDYEYNKALAKHKKKGICFRLLSDEKGAVRSFKTHDMDAVLKYLNDKHPNQYVIL